MQETMVFKLMLISSLICSLQASAIHWSINWTSDTNFLQKKIGALDAEIQTNFMILMGITSLMAIILVMAAHTCYLACKKKSQHGDYD